MTDRKYTIAVTGGKGLLASGFIRHALEQGHNVLAIDRFPPSFPHSYPPSPPDSTDGNDDDTSSNPLPSFIGDDVNAVDRILLQKAISTYTSQYRYSQVDLLDYDAFRQAVKDGECDAIVHLAAVYRRHDGYGNFLEGEMEEHEVYNINTAMSYNALNIAAELGIMRIVMASSVNAIGMLFSHKPQFDYFPIDGNHPCYPEDAYSLSKQTSEIQSSALIRRYSHIPLRIASLRFHYVVPTPLCSQDAITAHPGSPKDLWGWVSVSAASSAILASIIVGTETFPTGHEAFFIVAETLCGGMTRENAGRHWSDVEWRKFEEREENQANAGMFDTRKAERLLGWKEEGYITQ